jgi:hypothetical protein
MPGPEFEVRRGAETPETAPVRDAAAVAHEDLAMRPPDWDLLPVAEFVVRHRTGG